MVTTAYDIRISRRRTRTIAAFREGGRLVVVVPAHLTEGQRRDLIPPLVEKFLAREQRKRAPRGDADLTRRAEVLYDAHVAPHVEGPRPVFGVRWVSNMRSRWGSCTHATGEIRISDKLRTMPDWVVDHLLIHELTHLHIQGHPPRFHAVAGAHPGAERAEGFLAALEHLGVNQKAD